MRMIIVKLNYFHFVIIKAASINIFSIKVVSNDYGRDKQASANKLW